MAGNFSWRHVYVQWGGELPGKEQWSCGLRIAPMLAEAANTFTAEELAGAGLEGITTAIVNFHTRASTGIHNAAKLQFVKANFIGPDGKYESFTTNVSNLANTPGAVVGQPPPPNQVALAVTLRADVARGPASKGRFYLPLVTMGTMDATTGLLAADFVGGVEESATTLVADLNAAVLIPATPAWKVAIMSRRVQGPATREVKNIVVGRVADTQRRRRRSLAESYVD